MLSSELRLRGFDVLLTREPGGTPLGKRLRTAFLETEENVDPLSELLLFAADRAQHVNLLLKPAIAENRIVLSDRYADATIAYQGAGRGFDDQTVAQVTKLATDGLKPDLTFYFDIQIETAIRRAENQDKSRKRNRMDKEGKEFYQRVCDAYLEIARKEPKRFVIVDANQSISQVQKDVVAKVESFLEN